jgi:predicted nucleic acid-binding protein
MFDDIPNGCKIFIDSNIFIYHFLGRSEPCTALLERAENLEILAFTSVIVMTEVLHKLMIAEAVEKFNVRPIKVLRFFKDHPDSISGLTKCEEAIEEMSEFNIEVLPVGKEAIFESRTFRERHHLLTNDSLNLYAMNINGLKDIATNDRDFERVEWIKVWKP